MAPSEVLKQCTVEGTVVKLPNTQLDRKDYEAVKKKLELIGGKWKGGKIGGFVFQEDPTELLEQITNGENRNLKKEFQFFATPAPLAKRLVELADPASYDSILEPSAGQGAIVNAIINHCNPERIYCCELMPLNLQFLVKTPEVEIIGKDFLEHYGKRFDRIIANPPFAKNQDIDHIQHMYKHLNDGGRLVSIASKHWQISDKRKETEFREWLNSVGATVINLDGGEFKESGTNIATCIIQIDKAA